ncbi:hypothetical protein Taro_003062 [Colocasia esculenta]|uniref:Uncharacterized protein n=1 Tax=Colocasia esculenta TaxID=4460 RepID=A0A843TIR9_COLES|nr:hypothetical protein [Colocasia esculenta]
MKHLTNRYTKQIIVNTYQVVMNSKEIVMGSTPEKESLNPVEPVAEQADQAVAPEPPASSSLTTPAAPSPPSSSTAPPAPTTFKRPRSRSAQQLKVFSMTEAKTEEQWARSNKDLYSQFRPVQAARYPPMEAPLPLSEWFQIDHKNLFGPFIQKEIKFIRQYQMYSNYCYVNRLPESQLGQFRAAIRALSSSTAHTESLQVDFATLVILDVVFLPPLHALIMDSSVGTLIFEQAARVMARLFMQDGRYLSFPRFVFRQYLQGHIKADVLAPILSECERLSPEEWTKLYPLSAQQLGDLNASQASSNQPPLSPGEFLDANSIHLIRDSYLTWVERYNVFFALKKELRSLKIDYPLKIEGPKDILSNNVGPYRRQKTLSLCVLNWIKDC